MHSRARKKKAEKHSNRTVGIVLFLVIVIIAVGSIWLLIPPGQQLQTTSAYSLSAGDPTLTTCVSPSDVLLKFKFNLRIILNGTQIIIPAKIGDEAGCTRPMHTLDNSGDVYVESPIYYQYTLGDFFVVWGQVFTKDQILTLHADSNHMITLTVNGIPNFEFENHVVAPGEQVTITLT
ncbi:MAG: hypothetical protein ACLP5V_10270 [Candidatus Bathyarchaeia archaeon]